MEHQGQNQWQCQNMSQDSARTSNLPMSLPMPVVDNTSGVNVACSTSRTCWSYCLLFSCSCFWYTDEKGPCWFDWVLGLNTLMSINTFSNLPPPNPYVATSSWASSSVMAERWYKGSPESGYKSGLIVTPCQTSVSSMTVTWWVMFWINRRTSMIKNVHGEPFKNGHLVWFHCPAVPKRQSKKLHRTWSGPFWVVSKLSKETYHIQNKQRCRQRLFIQFNRMKPCPPDIRLTDPASVLAQRHPGPPPNPRLGKDIELLEYNDAPGTPMQPMSRYPRRITRPPDFFADYIRHWIQDVFFPEGRLCDTSGQ